MQHLRSAHSVFTGIHELCLAADPFNIPQRRLALYLVASPCMRLFLLFLTEGLDGALFVCTEDRHIQTGWRMPRFQNPPIITLKLQNIILC